MSQPPSISNASGTELVLDLGDAAAVMGYGADLLDQALTDRIAAAIMAAPVSRLASALHDVRLALQAESPAQLRKSVGFLGRLAGEDIELQARSRQLKARIGVLLAEAAHQAEALAAHRTDLEQLQTQLEHASGRLQERIDAGRSYLEEHPQAGLRSDGSPLHPRDHFEQRLQHLSAILASQRIGVQQLSQQRQQIENLLLRHRRSRELLIPALRQNEAAVVQNLQAADRLLACDDASAPVSDSAAARLVGAPGMPLHSIKEKTR